MNTDDAKIPKTYCLHVFTGPFLFSKSDCGNSMIYKFRCNKCGKWLDDKPERSDG